MQDDFAALLASMRKAAEAKRVEIASQTGREIAEINECAEENINSLRKQALTELEDRLRIECDCIMGNAKLEINNWLVREKNKAIEKVFGLASRQIENLDMDTRKEIFEKLIDDAVSIANSDRLRLRISNHDFQLWEKLKKKPSKSMSVELCDEARGTVIVETVDGLQSLDNSINTRFEKAKKVMRRQLGDILFVSEKAGENGK